MNKEELLKEVIIKTFNAYGLKHTVFALARYRYNGNSKGFTREDGLRYKLEMNLSIDDVNKIIRSQNIKSDNVLEDYIKKIVNEKDNLFIYLENAYSETLNKYDSNQARNALEQYILNGITKYITNNNNARDNLLKLKDKNILQILKKGLNTDAYCSKEDMCESFLNEMENKYIYRNTIKF